MSTLHTTLNYKSLTPSKNGSGFLATMQDGYHFFPLPLSREGSNVRGLSNRGVAFHAQLLPNKDLLVFSRGKDIHIVNISRGFNFGDFVKQPSEKHLAFLNWIRMKSSPCQNKCFDFRSDRHRIEQLASLPPSIHQLILNKISMLLPGACHLCDYGYTGLVNQYQEITLNENPPQAMIPKRLYKRLQHIMQTEPSTFHRVSAKALSSLLPFVTDLAIHHRPDAPFPACLTDRLDHARAPKKQHLLEISSPEQLHIPKLYGYLQTKFMQMHKR